MRSNRLPDRLVRLEARFAVMAEEERRQHAGEPADDGSAFLRHIVALSTGAERHRWEKLLASGAEAALFRELRSLDDRLKAETEGGVTFLVAIDRLVGDARRADVVRALCQRRHIGGKRAAAAVDELRLGRRGSGDPVPSANLILAAVKRATRTAA